MRLVSVLILGLATITTRLVAEPLHHRLTVRLSPQEHRLAVVDTLRLPDVPRGEPIHFVLHAGLRPELTTPGWRLEPLPEPVNAAFLDVNATAAHLADPAPLKGYALVPGPRATREVELRYAGVLHHPVTTAGEEYQRSFAETAGLVDEQGVYLGGTSSWVPVLGPGLLTFDLEVTGLPTGWDAVSQGRRMAHDRGPNGTNVTWSCSSPAEEVYLVAGPWTEYRDSVGSIELYAFLRSADEPLARRYLEATKKFLALYQSFLPPFPYPSFAVVENFWETGYGMPGFTLLGSKVLRFPWILTSSYPHELLHTWWGNSVYVDARAGNWCEGLTAYLADHLFAEQRGDGAAYRRDTLKKYTDFARDGKDFPLASFRSRYSAASEAVGYGKSLMVFHMLRRELGDQTFLGALHRLFAEKVYQRADFNDVAAAFSHQSGKDLRPFFASWTERMGAPQVRLKGAQVTPGLVDGTFTTEVVLEQVQEADPYPLAVPFAVTCAGTDTPELATASFSGRVARATVTCSGQPQRLEVDPHLDVMRVLDPEEVAPTLSALLGDDAPIFVTPTGASEAERAAWLELARAWQHGKAAPRLLPDSVTELPAGNLWALGWGNRLGQSIVAALAAQGVTPSSEGVAVQGRGIARAGESLVVVARRPGTSDQAFAWVAADPVAAIPGLARKLPHYTKYAYLGFRGEAPESFLKGTFEAVSSPLARQLSPGGASLRPRFERRAPLALMPPAFDSARLTAIVASLAGPAREGRGLGSAGLAAATDWVEQAMAQAGLEPAGDSGFRQCFTWRGGSPAREMALANLLGRIPGTDPALAPHPVLLLAHLDHLGRGWPDVHAGDEGLVHPGADDNASGVAVLLELARTLTNEPRPIRPILFAVTTGEEAGLVGARHLLQAMLPESAPMACVCLDTVGRLKDAQLFALDAASARELPFVLMGAGASLGVSVLSAPEKLDSSDHTACLERGIAGVQLFAGPTADYHRPTDTVDKIDADGMAKVAEVAREVVVYLAGRAEPLHGAPTAASAATPVAAGTPVTGSRPSLGVMPDFAFSGPGVRVAQVMPGSAAEQASLVVGDVVLALGETQVAGLKDLSEALRAHRVGEQVVVTIRRDGQVLHLPVTLLAR